MSNLPPNHDNPEEYRMSLGDHLEELRKRIILALIGFLVAGVVCAVFGWDVVTFFARPLRAALLEQHISPQLYFTSAGDPFTVYLRITMVCAAVISAPWIVWQLWLFVAAGLYPKERKAIWRFAPISIGLLLAGIVFCFFVVLPISLRFFLTFGGDMAMAFPSAPTTAPTEQVAPLIIPALAGMPDKLQPYQLWFDTVQQRMKFALPDGKGGLQTMVLQYGPDSLVSPIITLPDYIDMVLMWLIIFGLAFQLPLVVMALTRLGLVAPADLSKFRKYVYVALAIICSMLMPDVFSGTLLLMIPLCLLYELGIILGKHFTPKPE